MDERLKALEDAGLLKKVKRIPSPYLLERPCIVHNGSYFLTTIKVLRDGRIDCWGIMDRDEFIEKTNSKWITIDIPDEEELRIGNIGYVVRVAETLRQDGSLMFRHKWETHDSFVKEILDAVHIARGGKPVSQECYEAFEAYCENQTPENKEKLRLAYEAVPEQNRAYILGDQDLKDRPIRAILNAR